MSDYTPTTDEMRNVYASVQALGIRSGPPGAIEYNHGKAKFDRWLAEVERAAAARALEEAADDIESRRNEPGLVHLDIRYAGYYTGIRSGMESDSKALRARAEAYKEWKLT